MTGLTKSKRPRRRSEGALRTELRERREDAVEGCKMHASQLDRMEAGALGLARAERHDGRFIHRTYGQFAQMLRLPVDGMTVREIHNRYRTILRLTLRYLEEANVIAGVEPVYQAGEATGILIEMVPGSSKWVLDAARGCSSVGWSVARRPTLCDVAQHEPRASTPDFCPTPGGLRGVGDSSLSLASKAVRDARTRGCASTETRDRACRAAAARPALAELVSSSTRRSGAFVQASSPFAIAAQLARASTRPASEILPGSEIVRRRPELVALPPGVLLREARRAAARGHGRPDLRMSRGWDHKLEMACRVLKRIGYDGLEGRAAAAACVIDIATGRLDEDWRIGTSDSRGIGKERPRPQTLGGLAVCVRRYARAQRRTHRAATKEASRGSL